jgi:formylglycine-generating enzyme required for sulfatase activity
MLALVCAARAGAVPLAAQLAAACPEPPPLPILLNARDITAALAHGDAAPGDENRPTPAAFWSAIERWLQYSDLTMLLPSIQELLERGDCLVLIDDLDELADASRQPLYIAALARFVARYPDNRYVLTSRGFGTGILAPLISFERYRIAPLGDAEVDTLADRWYRAVSDRAGVLMLEDVSERVAALRGALHGDARLRELAATPRGLALCVLVHAEGHALPAERGLVLRRLAELLIRRWSHAHPAAPRGVGARRFLANGISERRLELLSALSLEFQSRLEPGGSQPLPMSAVEIKAVLSESRAMASIERRNTGADLYTELIQWGQRHSLLAMSSPGAYTMPHGQLREYLAAHALARLPDVVARAYAWREDPRWHETLRLAAAELGRGPALNLAHDLLRRLLELPSQGEKPRDLLLAAECLADLGQHSQVAHALRAGVCERLLSLMEHSTYLVAQRVRAGLLLGCLGDPRFAGPLPPLAWVGAGPFVLGCEDGYPDEGPVQLVDVPTFAIGVYPVTNQEYSVFLAENIAATPPRYWHDLRYNNPACPVVGVTWHDSVAYCAWLTKRLARADRLPPGMVARLPFEVEWEKAAAWDARLQARRRYAWGDTWDSVRANTADGRGDWITAPVGCYPDGVSPYGLHDCIGNVWEWTASEYASYPGASTPFREAGRYVLRGSSCASNPTHARCTYRSRLPAGYWRYHLGFRIVLGQPLA